MVSSRTSSVISPSLVCWLFALQPMASWPQNGCHSSKYLTSQLCLKSERTILSRGEGKVRKKETISHYFHILWRSKMSSRSASVDFTRSHWPELSPRTSLKSRALRLGFFCFSLAALGLRCCAGSLSLQLLFSCSAWASHCGGFSCWAAWCLGYLGLISCCAWAQ